MKKDTRPKPFKNMPHHAQSCKDRLDQMDNDLVHITKAHDVRRLRVCCRCGQLGDSASMVVCNDGLPRGVAHGRCYIAAFGMINFLGLPDAEHDKCRLNDVGAVAIKAILDRRAARKTQAARRNRTKKK